MALSEKTVPYKTWVKQSVVEALRRTFNAHPDKLLQETNVTIEYPNEEAKYPAIVVRFFERDISNAGISHYEVLEINGSPYKFQHYFYTGDLEFAIHALTSVDRDLLADSLVQTLGMGDLSEWTANFFNRIYVDEFTQFPKGEYNHINVNSDKLQGFGETQNIAPWNPEDVMVYQASYRVGISGGFYSLPPAESASLGYVEEVDTFPYIGGVETVPTGRTDDSSQWTGIASDFADFRARNY